ncbi:hypothetical protein M3Y97_00183500 [Aphelenchoides bicaudatus]|nr:hypothetical protein M3Y97_00183500 [Aphelenchoides bicaudatus]
MSTEQETPPVKHQIPHIITSDLAHHSYSDTSPPSNEDASKSPSLHGIRPQRSPIQMRNDSTDIRSSDLINRVPQYQAFCIY